MSLVRVLVLFRAGVCAFRVSELLVVRLSFVVKLFCLRCVSCEMLKFSCRVSNSSFSFEFVVEIFDSSFEFKFLEFSCRVLKSKFSMSCSIRLLEFRCSSRFLEFQFSIRISSSSSLNFRVELVVEFRIRVSRFVALFDFSNLTLNSSSNSTSRISCRISNSNVSSKFLVEIFVSLLYLISRISL